MRPMVLTKDLLNSLPDRLKRLLRDAKPKSASKYHSRKVVDEDGTFDSEKEHRRWHELLLMEKAGIVRSIDRQVPYALNTLYATQAFGIEREYRVGTYKADFVYERLGDNGQWTKVVEDVKGYRTKEYRMKKRHFEAQYGMKLHEV